MCGCLVFGRARYYFSLVFEAKRGQGHRKFSPARMAGNIKTNRNTRKHKQYVWLCVIAIALLSHSKSYFKRENHVQFNLYLICVFVLCLDERAIISPWFFKQKRARPSQIFASKNGRKHQNKSKHAET